MKHRVTPRKQQRRGLSVILVVALCGGLLLGGVSLYFYYQRQAVEKAKLEKQQRLAAAQAALQRQLKGLLDEANEVVQLQDEYRLKRLIHRISVLDVEAEYGQEVVRLKVTLQRMAQRREAIEVLKREVLDKITKEDFAAAYKVLDQLKNDYAIEDAGLENQLKIAEKKAVDLAHAEQEFEAHITQFLVDAAAESLLRYQQLGAKAETVAAMQQRLQAQQKKDKEVRALCLQISTLDTGKFSAELIQQVKAARQRYPQHPALTALQKKLESYPQTLRVPADVSSIDEALLRLRAGDSLVLGEGEFYVEATLTKAIRLQGAGREKTRLCSLTKSNAALELKHQGKVEIANLTIVGDREADTGHALIALHGGELNLIGCKLSHSSGHGVAVVGGSLTANDCVFSDHAWDGVAVCGEKSRAVLVNCCSEFNGDRGLDVWQAAAAAVTDCTFSNNGKSGVLALGAKTALRMRKSSVAHNGASGVSVVNSAVADCVEVQAHGNKHSGFSVDGNGSDLKLKKCEAANNVESGLTRSAGGRVSALTPLVGEGNGSGLLR